MRKPTWGVIVLAVFALSFGWPVRALPDLHRLLGLAGLAGYLLLSFFPPIHDQRQRKLLIAGVVCGLVSFVLALAPLPVEANVLSRILAVAMVALPLWLVAGVARYAFVAAGVLAAVTILPGLVERTDWTTSLHAYVAALAAGWVAWSLEKPASTVSAKKRPVRKAVVAKSNIVVMTPEDKAAALERVEQRFRNGEIPEHVYWDKRQEIESK
jgi:hypothetical protein